MNRYIFKRNKRVQSGLEQPLDKLFKISPFFQSERFLLSKGTCFFSFVIDNIITTVFVKKLRFLNYSRNQKYIYKTFREVASEARFTIIRKES